MAFSYQQPIHAQYCVQESLVLAELDLVRYWQSIKPGTVFIDKKGQSITIFYPGRRNPHEGPDFLDALIWTNNQMKMGSVELHIRESFWFAHGHHLDERYKKVILHGVHKLSPSIFLPIPTIQVNPTDGIYPFRCSIPDHQLGETQIRILLKIAENRWQERVSLFKCASSQYLEVYFIESLANFGCGENRNLYREMGQQIFRELSIVSSKSKWIDLFHQKADSISWKRAGVRPVRNPLKIMDNIAAWSYDLFKKGLMEKSLNEIHTCFKKYGFGKGTWVEWCGNVHFPFMAVLNPKYYNSYYKKWNSLRLPNSYGILSRFFKGKLSQKDLRSFAISQGLLSLKKHYCSHWHCDLCKLKRSL